jgi:hypothetical protein
VALPLALSSSDAGKDAAMSPRTADEARRQCRRENVGNGLLGSPA